MRRCNALFSFRPEPSNFGVFAYLVEIKACEKFTTGILKEVPLGAYN